jgi:hypothetical protein
MTNARRSAGLRRVSTATYGLVAASMTGVAVVTGVVAHQGVHHGTSSPAAQTDDGSSTGSAPASQSANNDDTLGSATVQSPAAVSPAVQSPVGSPAQQQPTQQTPIQVLPGAPAPVVGAVQKPAHHHAVTSGS